MGTALFREYWIYLPDTKQAFKIIQDWFRKKLKKVRNTNYINNNRRWVM